MWILMSIPHILYCILDADRIAHIIIGAEGLPQHANLGWLATAPGEIELYLNIRMHDRICTKICTVIILN